MNLSQQLREYIAACFTGLWVQSFEHEDALREIAQLCRQENWRLASWSIDEGLKIVNQPSGSDAGGNDPLAAIRAINALANPDSSALLVLVNFHRFLNSAEIVQALASQITAGKQNRTFVVIHWSGRAASCFCRHLAVESRSFARRWVTRSGGLPCRSTSAG